MIINSQTEKNQDDFTNIIKNLIFYFIATFIATRWLG